MFLYCHNDPINFTDIFGLEESRDKEVLTQGDYEKIQMLTAIYNYAKYSINDMAIADEAHRQAVKIRQQEKYSGVEGYGPVYIKKTSNELKFTTYGGAYDKYKYSNTSAKVEIYISNPLSLYDARWESGNWINEFSDAGVFALIGEKIDFVGTIASMVNEKFNPLYNKVNEGDIIVTVNKKQFFKNKELQFYFQNNDKQRSYYVRGK